MQADVMTPQSKRGAALHKSQISSGMELGLTAIFCKDVLRGVYCCLQMLVLLALPRFPRADSPSPQNLPVPTGLGFCSPFLQVLFQAAPDQPEPPAGSTSGPGEVFWVC